jgi:hypothetical protein
LKVELHNLYAYILFSFENVIGQSVAEGCEFLAVQRDFMVPSMMSAGSMILCCRQLELEPTSNDTEVPTDSTFFLSANGIGVIATESAQLTNDLVELNVASFLLKKGPDAVGPSYTANTGRM